MIPIVVPLRSFRRERAQLLQKLQHVIPAVGLLSAGLDGLRHEPQGFALGLAVVEIVTTVLLIGTIGRALRAARTARRTELPHAHGVDWIEIWSAGVLFAEAGERWHVTHHIARPTIVTGLVTLALGVLHGRLAARIARRRVLRVDDEGLFVSAKPFRSLRAPWRDVTEIAIQPGAALIRTRAGRVRRLVFSDLDRPDDVRGALEVARARLATEAADTR